jgi:light-regulated signal transduction histidine kinase (bacteriophytochrome)
MDITSEKRTAELLEKKIEERTAELQFVNEKLRQFTYAASHDLQDPLRKISFFLDRLFTKLGTDLSADNQSIIERIQHTTGRMRTLIDNLLDYSNTSLGGFSFQPVNLAELVRGVVDDMEASIIETSAGITVEATGNVYGDERQLRQLIQNLLSNALKYRRKDIKPKIHIQAAVQSGINAPEHLHIPAGAMYHAITVSDNGIGFEPEYADTIFKLFQRLHGKNTYEGTGVGLALVQKVVENHGGFIWADGRPGEGSVFTVLLPVMEGQQDA